MKIAIVAVHESKTDLSDFLSSLSSSELPFKLFLLDITGNCKIKLPEVKSIAFPKRINPVKALNYGIIQALREGAEYVGILHENARVEKNWLSECLRTLQMERVGIVGSSIVFQNHPHILYATGINLNLDLHPIKRDYGNEMHERSEESEVIAVSAISMFIKSAVFSKTGLFDPLFPSLADVEFCLRVRRYTDYRIIHNPRAVVRFSPHKEENISFSHYLLLLRYLPLEKMFWRLGRTVKVRVEKEAYIGGKLKAFFPFLSAIFFLPWIFLKRLSMDIRHGIREEYMKMLLYEKGIPGKHPYPPESYTAKTPSSRILFGVNDLYSGKGFSAPFGIPVVRWVKKEASILLPSIPAHEGFVQIHILGKGRVRIEVEQKIHEEEITGWKTIVFPVKIRKKKIEVKIKGENMLVNEISLIPKNSPFLRRIS